MVRKVVAEGPAFEITVSINSMSSGVKAASSGADAMDDRELFRISSAATTVGFLRAGLRGDEAREGLNRDIKIFEPKSAVAWPKDERVGDGGEERRWQKRAHQRDSRGRVYHVTSITCTVIAKGLRESVGIVATDPSWEICM